MSSTILDSYKQLIELYNQYRRSGDTPAALRMAHKIVGIADEQCAAQGASQALKEYYRETAAAVKEFIADVRLGARVFTNGSPNEEDKIKATDWFSADIPNLTMRDVAGLKEVRDEFMVNIFAPLSPRFAPVYKNTAGKWGCRSCSTALPERARRTSSNVLPVSSAARSPSSKLRTSWQTLSATGQRSLRRSLNRQNAIRSALSFLTRSTRSPQAARTTNPAIQRNS